MPGRVAVFPTEADPAAVAAALDGRPWLFLGTDYRRQLEFEAALGTDAQIAAGPLVDAAARRLRRPFLELMTELGRRHASLEWWTSRVAERNTMLSPLFLHCCWLSVVHELEGPVVLVCESGGVRSALGGNEPRQRGSALRVLREALGLCVRFAGARRGGPGKQSVPSGRLALLRTWVDEGSLESDGGFRDRYLPGVAEFLEARGWQAVTLPVIFNPGDSYAAVWRHLQATGRRFAQAESFLRWSDVLVTLRRAWRQRRLPSGPVELEGIDVTPLFEAERRRTVFDAGSLDALLSERLPLRLAQAGWRPELVIDLYEGLIPEKGLHAGLREHLPETRIVGFQHSTLEPMLLSKYATAGEVEIAPLPDRVVCNGELFRRVLVDEGLPDEITAVGPALRFPHLVGRRVEAPRTRERRVLVTLPLQTDASAELLVKVERALGAADGTEVVLKPHPMSREDVSVPQGFTIERGAMGPQLERAGVVVSLASSTLYEALAAGVPVVVVGRDAALDLNPLGWVPDLDRVVRSEVELRAEVERWLDASDTELAAYRERGERLLRESFSPIDESTMSALI